MSEKLLAVPALRGVDVEQVSDDLLRLRADLVPNGGGEVVLTVLDLLEENHVVLVVERRETAEQNVKDNTYRPVVALLSVKALLQNLWGNVAGGAAGGLREGL